MKHHFTISLQQRLTLTYVLFVGAALAVLTLVINIFATRIFIGHVKDNISLKSTEIVHAVISQYHAHTGIFDETGLEALGRSFTHQGYLITVLDAAGEPVWDARACDKEGCSLVMTEINLRMQSYYGTEGHIRRNTYPLVVEEQLAGSVTVETYGPFFYNETERDFLSSINRLLLSATLVMIFFTAVISILLAGTIARPVNMVSCAARSLASGAMQKGESGAPPVHIDESSRTREIAGLAQSINGLARCLEEAERRQKQLLSDLAHELRTPLACLQGTIEAVIDGVYPSDREHLESCHEEILRLARLVQDLNTLTCLEWEKISLNKTEFDLSVLLRATAEQFKAAAREKHIALHLDLLPCPVYAEYDRLKQVFINLLSNAVNYTNEGMITIRVFPDADNGGAGTAVITDTGTGIAPEDTGRIFERLYRTDKSRSRSTGGAGIGLAIAAAIINAHGGSIEAESDGTGSSFRVTIPRS